MHDVLRSSQNAPGVAARPRPGVAVIEIPTHALEVLSGRMPEGMSVLVVPPSAVQPEFIRLPKHGTGEPCSVTGLKRSSLEELLRLAGPKIKTRILRQKGSTRGITLIHRQSLIEFIENELPAPDYAEVEGEGGE